MEASHSININELAYKHSLTIAAKNGQRIYENQLNMIKNSEAFRNIN